MLASCSSVDSASACFVEDRLDTEDSMCQQILSVYILDKEERACVSWSRGNTVLDTEHTRVFSGLWILNRQQVHAGPLIVNRQCTCKLFISGY